MKKITLKDHSILYNLHTLCQRENVLQCLFIEICLFIAAMKFDALLMPLLEHGWVYDLDVDTENDV